MGWFIAAGALIGAIPATVMEFLSPLWEATTITAFGMPMAAGAGAGALVWMWRELRHP